MLQENNLDGRDKHELKVLGAGLSRTGTYGLSQILNSVGFGKCYHGFIKWDKPYQNDFWGKIAEMSKDERKKVDWNEFFYDYKGYGDVYHSCVDWPSAECWKEIAEFYPNCKVILGFRDAEKWYNSMTKGLYPKLSIFDYFYWHYLLHSFHRKEWEVNNKLYLNKYGGIFNMHKEDVYKNKSMELFEQHIKSVKEYFEDERTKKEMKKSRLFIYDLERKDQDKMKIELLEFLEVDIEKYKDQITIQKVNTTERIQWYNDFANRRFRCQIMTFVCWVSSIAYIIVQNNSL